MSFIPGASVGPYRIVEQAERIGVATIYTAYQPSLERYVSLVVVPALGRDDASSRRQRQRQLERLLELRHPNILATVDHGEHLGVPYLVTELIETEPLAERLGAPWPLDEVVRVLNPIAEALDYAHQRGIVHGQVRPSTVLLTPDGAPLLAGFGQWTGEPPAARDAIGGEPGGSQTAVVEEIALAQYADRRGLALTAYEMLTGRTVEVEPTDFDRPLPPEQLGSPLLAPPVERVLLRELSGDPADRFPDASELVSALGAPLAPSRPIEGSLPPAPPAAPPPGAESRRRMLTVALIFATLAALGTLAVLLRGGEPVRPVAAPARSPIPAGSPEATGLAAESGPAGAAAPGSPVAGLTQRPVVTSTAVQASGASVTGAAQPSVAASPVQAAPTIPLMVPTPEVASADLPTPAAGTGPPGGAATARPGAAPSGPSAQLGATSTPALPARPTAVPPAAGSTRLPSTWRVMGDPSGRWMLDDEGRVVGRTESGASVVLFPESVDDVSFSALVSTTTCQATLVFRAQDDENQLMAIYVPDGLPNPGSAGGGVWLYQRVEGLDLPIRAVRPSTVRPAGEPVRLKIVTGGPQIAISLNDELAVEAADTAARAGRLGLMVYSTSGRLCEATFGDIER
jgi:serine/threonine-protein kinase